MDKETTKKKLILAVLQGDDYADTVDELNRGGFFATVLSSTGGFLKKKSMTLMIGVEEARLQGALDILKQCAGRRQQMTYSDLSMSAGGPIVEPDAANIIISPICAHMMGSRSFVLNPGRRISVMAEKLHGRRAYLSVDGVFAMDLSNGDTVTVEKSEHYTLMADLGLRSFYEIAYGKLT